MRRLICLMVISLCACGAEDELVGLGYGAKGEDKKGENQIATSYVFGQVHCKGALMGPNMIGAFVTGFDSTDYVVRLTTETGQFELPVRHLSNQPITAVNITMVWCPTCRPVNCYTPSNSPCPGQEQLTPHTLAPIEAPQLTREWAVATYCAGLHENFVEQCKASIPTDLSGRVFIPPIEYCSNF